MKKLLFIALTFLGSVIVSAQYGPYKKWSLELDYGNHYLHDAVNENEGVFGKKFTQVGLATRYNFSRTLGAMLKYNHNNIRLESGGSVNLDRISAEAVVDIFDLVDMDTPNAKWTMLAHIGPGYAWTPSESAATLNGGVTGLYSLSPSWALKADYSSTGFYGDNNTAGQAANAVGITALLNSFSVGAVWYPAKKKRRSLPHGDWFKPAEVQPIIQSDTTIVNNHVHNKTIIEEYTPTYREFVFFHHDDFVIHKSELNAVYQIYYTLAHEPLRKVVITGWASPTASSLDYNLALSESRCNELKKKLIAMGIDESRISIDPQGKDHDFDDENLTHDVGRRIELLIE